MEEISSTQEKPQDSAFFSAFCLAVSKAKLVTFLLLSAHASVSVCGYSFYFYIGNF